MIKIGGGGGSDLLNTSSSLSRKQSLPTPPVEDTPKESNTQITCTKCIFQLFLHVMNRRESFFGTK